MFCKNKYLRNFSLIVDNLCPVTQCMCCALLQTLDYEIEGSKPAPSNVSFLAPSYIPLKEEKIFSAEK